MNKLRATFSVYIFNAIEDEWGFISSFPARTQKKLIHESNRFADCYLFANAHLPAFTLIAPHPIDTVFKTYFESLTGSSSSVAIPQAKTPFLCDAIMQDKKLFASLVQVGKTAKSLTLYAYSITSELFRLKKALEKAGVHVLLPEAPLEKNLRTVSQYGSKSGFRNAFSSLMPKGKVCKTIHQLQTVFPSLYANSKAGLVVKTDKGNAGQGVFIFRKSKYPTEQQANNELQRIITKNSYLHHHPLVVEEFIDTSFEKQCPFPSVECFIHQNGTIEIPYYCNMIVTPEGEFYGMEMHEGVLTPPLKKRVLTLSRRIARTMRKAGYKGRFDIDMIYDGKKLYADESNTRINGGTDTFLMVKKLVGPSVFSKRYVLTGYREVPKRYPTFTSLYEALGKNRFDIKTKLGILINSSSVIQNGGFSYIVVTRLRKDALHLFETIKKL